MARSRSYVFTINNYDDSDIQQVHAAGWQYLIYGKEVGDQGTPHLQGYMYFKSQRSLSAMKKKLPRAHLEIRRGTHMQAKAYCMKDGDYVEDGLEPEKNGGDTLSQRGDKNKRLRDTPLDELVNTGELNILDVKRLKQARDILANCGEAYVADDVRGVWLWGAPGAGKTHLARSYDDVFYVKAQNKWFDGYQGEKTIVLDDLDHGGACLGHYLKIWADKWSCSGEVKGGVVPLVHERFVVTSNYTIEQLWPEDLEMQAAIKRRFVVKHVVRLQ